MCKPADPIAAAIVASSQMEVVQDSDWRREVLELSEDGREGIP